MLINHQQHHEYNKKIVEFDNIVFSIDDESKTACIFRSDSTKEKILIPRSISHNSEEYDITGISGIGFSGSIIKSLDFVSDSKLQTIGLNVFLFTEIETLTIPSEVIDLKDGWCNGTSNLNRVIVSPSNPRYCSLNEQMIIGKSSLEVVSYDCLIFCIRNIKTIIIPNFIKYICTSSFSQSSINSIKISSQVIKIGEYAFCFCKKLRKIEFSSDSKLQIIDKNAFSSSSLECISIPFQVKEIAEDAFSNCKRLKILEFVGDIDPNSLSSSSFKKHVILMFQKNLKNC